MGALVAAGRLDLTEVCEMVLAARGPDEEEPAAPGDETEMIDSGLGLAVLAACLRQLAAHGGEAAMAAAWRATGHRVARFVPEVRCHKCTAFGRSLCEFLSDGVQWRRNAACLVLSQMV